MTSTSHSTNKLSTIFFIGLLLIVNNSYSQQKNKDNLMYADDPNLDQVPEWYLDQISNNPKQASQVITVDDYDNYYLGVDLAESHISVNPIDPTQFFTAYNIDETHRTIDIVQLCFRITPIYIGCYQSNGI